MTTHIMVVDDEPAIGKLLIYQLQTLGYRVTYVQDGLLALQRLEREHPDLLLLDVMMPSISGWDVCRHVRSHSSLPIIMLTAKSSDADVVTGLTSGADDYIAKPFSMAQLQARIEAVLRRTRLIRTHAVNESPERPAQANAPLQLEDSADVPSTPVFEETTPNGAADGIRPRLGPLLRETRLARGFSLHQAGTECNIHWEFLQAIEQENFSYVPRKQLHYALHTYSRYLGLNLRDIVGQPTPEIQPTAFQRIQPYRFVIIALVLVLLASAVWLSLQ